MEITGQDVLNAFDSFGDSCVQYMALQMKLRNDGFNVTEIVDAINGLINQGVLAYAPT